MSARAVKVADVMRTSLHMVSGLASVQEALDLMNQHGISSLVIERRHDGDEFGLVTIKDIASKVVALNKSPERVSVYEIMRKPALTISADMHVKYAIRLLSELRYSRALVTGGGGTPGYVTLRDLVLSNADLEPKGQLGE